VAYSELVYTSYTGQPDGPRLDDSDEILEELAQQELLDIEADLT